MTNVLKLLGFFAGIIPIVLNLIKEFEVPGFGSQKKQSVLDSVSMIYDVINDLITISMPKEKVLNFVGGFIDLAVAFFNIVGIFKNKTENPS